MDIGGFQKFSLIDYPGKICAVVFTQGCNFRCPYCHNPELVNPRMYQEPVPEEEVLEFLKKRKTLLEGVTITGGEPLLQEDISVFLKNIKKIGYAVKLDTNGSFPEKLRWIVDKGLVDYIAMDIKAPLEKYAFVAGIDVMKKDIKESIDIIMRSNLNYQFRTTTVKSFLTFEDLKVIARMIKGARRYVLQKFVPAGKLMDSSLGKEAEYSEEKMRKFQDAVTNLI